MPRIFMSHSSRDDRSAVALKKWLSEQRPELANEIFLDIDPETGLRLGEHWKAGLFTSTSRCEHVICLLSQSWVASSECKTEYRTAEGLGKRIIVARLEELSDGDITSQWQRCDLFADGPQTEIKMAGGPPVLFNTAALDRLKKALQGGGTGPECFAWPPQLDPERAPYRGWEPFEDIDAGVFFGRQSAIEQGLDELRGMRFRLLSALSGIRSLFVVLGPSGSGKSSFLRAGLIPRLQRDDRRFLVLGIMRPERHPITGADGFAKSIHSARRDLGLAKPPLGDIKRACLEDPDRIYELLLELRESATARLAQVARADGSAEQEAGADDDEQGLTLVLPLDQAEELFATDAGTNEQAEQFLQLIRELIERFNATETGLIVVATIRTDLYEAMQNHPALEGVASELFDELKPMPREEFKEVITGPAARASEGGHPLDVDPKLVSRLLADAADGADTLPLLALTLSRLYADYADSGRLTLADYEAMGGMRDVVNNEIEFILANSRYERDEALALLRSAFIPWLATINPDSNEAVRRVARQSELPDTGGLLAALIEKRLLVRDQRDGEAVVEVALESLLRQWDDLDRWLREERQNLKTVDDIERSVAAWRTHREDPAWLLTGTRLTDAEALSATAGFSNRLESAREYLAACREAEDERLRAEEERRQAELRYAQERQKVAESHNAVLRKQSRVLRVFLLATALAAVIAIVGGVVAAVARNDAQQRFRQATGLRLASEAQSILARTRPGGDVRAFQQLVTASALASDNVYGPLYEALSKRADTMRVIESPANSVAFSPDGDRFVTAGPDGALRIWDAETGEPVGAPLTGHTDWVTSVVFGARRVVSGDRNGTVRLWNADDGSPVGEALTGHDDQVTAVALSPDGRWLASASADDTVRLWDADNSAPIGQPLVHADWVMSAAFSRDGKTLATGSRDGTIRLWDVLTGKPVGEPLVAHTGTVTSVAMSADRLASGGADRTAKLWEIAPLRPVGVPLSAHSAPVTGVAFSPDGNVLVTSSEDRTVRRWSTETGAPLGEPMTDHTDKVTSVAFSPDGERIATTSQDDSVRVWKAKAGVGLGKPIKGHRGEVNSLAFNGDRVVTGGADGSLRWWDIRTGTAIGKPIQGGTGIVNDVAVSPDGHRLASAGQGGKMQLWDADRGTRIGPPIAAHDGDVMSVAFSGDRLVSGAADGTVRMWDAADGKPIGDTLTGHTDSVNEVAFSPDGRHFATAGADGTVRLWDADTRETVGEPITAHSDWVTSVAFSPDGRRLATGGRDDVVRLWDVESGDPIGNPLDGHTNWVNDVAFSPDGRRLASASSDGTIRLWNADSGEPLGEAIAGHAGWVNAVAFSSDGNMLATTGDDESVRLWLALARPEDLCDKLTYNMNQRQWDAWVSPDIKYFPACPQLPPAPE